MPIRSCSCFLKLANLGISGSSKSCRIRRLSPINVLPTIDLQTKCRTFSTGKPEEELLVEVKNGIRKITFNRPEKKNAVTKQMVLSFVLAMMESNNDENTKVVVLTGSGDYFTSGIDLSGFSPVPKATSSEVSEEIKLAKKSETDAENKPSPKKKSGVIAIVTTLIDIKKPLIALVNGPAVGFGVTMLGLFDAVYCSDRATFHTRFTEYGLPPEFCSTYTFPRIMGYGKATEMLIFNTKMDSTAAFKSGLVSTVIPHDTFVEESRKKVEEISKLPLKSLIYSKELVRGREKEILKEVNRSEQSKFDPELAREVKRKFMEKMLEK